MSGELDRLTIRRSEHYVCPQCGCADMRETAKVEQLQEGAAVHIEVSNEELVTVRDAMRGLNRMIDRLLSGEQHQFVLMHRGQMVARIVPLPPPTGGQ
jgi:hypothetical protein